jgi:hypothetical protein
MGSGRNKKIMLALPGSEPFLLQSEKAFTIKAGAESALAEAFFEGAINNGICL